MAHRPIYPDNSSDNGGESNHSHSNLPVLEKVRVDSFNRLYSDSNYNPDHLTEGTVLALLGSLSDSSGYSNLVTPTPGQQNPVQVIGLDNNPSLALQSNLTELSIPTLPSKLIENGATLYLVYSNFNSPVEGLINTSGADNWWRFSLNGHGYFGIFRNQRTEQYPQNMPVTGNYFVSIHSRASDYEVFVNNQSKGVVAGSYWGGDRFIICPQGRACNCSLALLLVVPFWVDKTSFFHQRKVEAIKGKFPSLPFSI